MNLSELAVYAWEKFHIREEFKWTDFPGFSVLKNPYTGKWAALLMRQWDPERGLEIQRCDIRCGQRTSVEENKSFLSRPFRMKGQKWTGVIMEEDTDPETVFRLFDRAVYLDAERGYAVVPEQEKEPRESRLHVVELEPREARLRALELEPGIEKGIAIADKLPEVEDELSCPAGTVWRGNRERQKPKFPDEKNRQDAQEAGRMWQVVCDSRLSEEASPGQSGIYVDTPLNFEGVLLRGAGNLQNSENLQGTGILQSSENLQDTGILQSSENLQGAGNLRNAGGPQDTGSRRSSAGLQGFGAPGFPADDIPQPVINMRKLYVYGDGSYAQKCRNFYRQGKYMEHYEDDRPWNGEFRHYFPTYHDLNIRQLRGYFTWRTAVRRGIFRPVCASMAYIYLYELLCGIGADSPEDALQKMQEFETGFLDAGLGDAGMQKNLRRWMLEYAVLKGLPPETARQLADPELLEKDQALGVLKNSSEYSDAEICRALSFFAGKKLEQSPVISGFGERGELLFATAWRAAAERYEAETGKDWFASCFGEAKIFPWHPLANAVFWEETAGQTEKEPVFVPGLESDGITKTASGNSESKFKISFWEKKNSGKEYVLDACRRYRCMENGSWRELRYETLYFDRTRFQGFVHAADCRFRRYLKTGHYLREKAEEAWALPYIQDAVEADRKAEEEAARPVITIDFSGLEQIRRDARVTQDSLLTENESETAWPAMSGRKERPAADVEEQALRLPGADFTEQNAPEVHPDSAAGQNRPSASQSGPLPERKDMQTVTVDAVNLQILTLLLAGEDPAGLIREKHLMPSVVADAINEAFFDEIGDTILECENEELHLIEDYREDVSQLIEEMKEY